MSFSKHFIIVHLHVHIPAPSILPRLLDLQKFQKAPAHQVRHHNRRLQHVCRQTPGPHPSVSRAFDLDVDTYCGLDSAGC
jgi:hypothetical protein